MSRGTSIAGRKNTSGPDFYCTPEWATRALMDKCSEVGGFEGTIYEPASGNGAMAKVIEDYYPDVIASDIQEECYGESNVDFLDITNFKVDNIITNPPYKLAQEFVNKALELTNSKVAMLLKLTFLESTKRHKWWKTVPLRKVWVFSRRVTMYPYGTEKPKNSGTITYAWFLWEHNYTDEPVIGWIE